MKGLKTRCHNNLAYIIQVWFYEEATAKPAVCLEGISRGFLSHAKYDHLIAAIPSYSGVGANQVNQLWVQRFQKVTIFRPCDLNPPLYKWAAIWNTLTGTLLLSTMENHPKILKYNDKSLLYGNQLTPKRYAWTHVGFCKS